MKPKVYVTYKIPDKPLELLKERCDVTVNEMDRLLTYEELRENLKGMDGAICMYSDRIDKDLIDYIEGIKVIANYAVGFNNVDFEYAASKGIKVTNTPGVLTDATAEHAFGLMLAAARRIAESDRYTRAGKFKNWTTSLYVGQEVTGKTVGIIGGGKIGASFAKKAKGFDMKILYTDMIQNKALEEEFGAVFTDMDTLLKESDFITVHVPLTESTRHLIGIEQFKKMKKTAVFVNTSRGPVVDEKALAQALREGYIWSAGIDVYENEPQVEPDLLKLENVVLTPHIGSATVDTRERMGMVAVKNVLAALNGEIPPNCINFK